MPEQNLAEGQAYRQWLCDTSAERLAATDGAAADIDGFEPLISIALPVFDTDQNLLQATIESVLAQRYPHWQLCIADDASTRAAVWETIAAYSKRDKRIEALRLDANRGIAGATNAAAAMARGRLTALLDHDDLLADDALLWVVRALRRHPGAQLIYTDSDRLDEGGQRCEPYFKPGWNYDLLLSHNYINHFTAFDTRLLRDVGGLREGYDGSQDYDLILRVVERIGPDPACGGSAADRIVHVPRLLYHWRRHRESVTASGLKQAVAGARRAVADHLRRRGCSATVRANPLALIYQRVLWSETAVSMALLVIGHDREAVEETRAAFAPLSPQPPDTLVAASSELSSRARDWAARQHADLLCLICAGCEPETPAPPAELSRFFSRRDVQAAVAATGPAGDLPPPVYADVAGAPVGAFELHRRLGATNSGLGLMDQAASQLAGDCIVVRREAFGELCVADHRGIVLRDTMSRGDTMVWTPHVRVRRLSRAAPRA